MLRDTSSWPKEYLEEEKALNPKTLTPDFDARSASYRATRRFSSSRFLLFSEL
jgi:hypothetical protein